MGSGPGAHPQPGGAQFIGKGRSGAVFLDRDPDGREIVRKIFGHDPAARLVLYLFTGAPNPYVWCEDAIAAAAARRRILERLVPIWIGPALRLPATHGHAWNAEHRAFELRSEFIRGRHVPLQADAPNDAENRDPLPSLVRRIQRPLQRRLREAGFDGLAWQAGLGNPVAANNFMLVEASEAPGPGNSFETFVWIDLESGVPALFPMNPLRLMSFYLPKSLRHRGALFDDVDVPKLRAYLHRQRDAWAERIDPGTWAALLRDVDELERRQHAWKRQSRAHRSIAYALSQERISAEQAEHYRRHALRWYARLAQHGIASLALRVARLPAKIARRLWRIRWRMWLRSAKSFATSQRFRTRMAHRYVFRRIGVWEMRRCITPAEAQALREHARHDSASEYLTDFGVHLAIKPIDMIAQYTIAPALLATGHYIAAGVIVTLGGILGRTAYTLGRLIQQAIRGERLPWVALGAGFLPMIGTLAYPLQLLYRAERHNRIAQFIVYDGFALIGQAIPIWGGRDSLTEHWCNRLPGVPVVWWRRLRRKRSAETMAQSLAEPR